MTDERQDALEDQQDAETLATDGNQIAFSVHVMMLEDGQFAVVPTGDPNPDEMHMMLARALARTQAMINAQVLLQTQKLAKQQSSGIVVP